MTANHIQTVYPSEDYGTTENLGLLEELQKVNYLLTQSTVFLLKPITVNPLLSPPSLISPPSPPPILKFTNKMIDCINQ